ncbi:MAG: hypothetical protein ACOY3X_08285 [Pseudomonadota bacterium]
MKAIHLQRLLAFIFLGLGGWCLFFPATVEALVLQPAYYVGNDTSALFIGCFGAQAVLVGTVILTSVFTPRTFLVFGLIASVPFFGFNYHFHFVKGMFTDWMLLDFAGNVGILTLGLLGYRLKKRELAEQGAS